MILIKTPIAVFTAVRASSVMSTQHQIDYAARYAMRQPDWIINVWNEQGELVYAFGGAEYHCKVWSHTPFMFGMNPEKCQSHFEERLAEILLVSALEGLDFSKAEDGRYLNTTICVAWMTYVDMALESFATLH